MGREFTGMGEEINEEEEDRRGRHREEGRSVIEIGCSEARIDEGGRRVDGEGGEGSTPPHSSFSSMGSK